MAHEKYNSHYKRYLWKNVSSKVNLQIVYHQSRAQQISQIHIEPNRQVTKTIEEVLSKVLKM